MYVYYINVVVNVCILYNCSGECMCGEGYVNYIIYVKCISYIISYISYIICVHYIICVAYIICVVLVAGFTEVLHRES